MDQRTKVCIFGGKRVSASTNFNTTGRFWRFLNVTLPKRHVRADLFSK